MVAAPTPLEESMDRARAVIEQLREVREKSDAMRKLERSLAYEHALSVIESNCSYVGEDTELYLQVFDLDAADQEAEDSLRQAVEYLDYRGLLGRCEANRQYVCVLDESEATQ